MGRNSGVAYPSKKNSTKDMMLTWHNLAVTCSLQMKNPSLLRDSVGHLVVIYKRTNDIWVYNEGKCYSGQIMVSYQNVLMTGGFISRDYVVHRIV